VRLKTIAVQS